MNIVKLDSPDEKIGKAQLDSGGRQGIFVQDNAAGKKRIIFDIYFTSLVNNGLGVSPNRLHDYPCLQNAHFGN